MYVLDAITDDTVKIERDTNPNWGLITLPKEAGNFLSWKITQLWLGKILAFDVPFPADLNQRLPLTITIKNLSEVGWKVGDEITWGVKGTILTINKV